MKIWHHQVVLPAFAGAAIFGSAVACEGDDPEPSADVEEPSTSTGGVSQGGAGGEGGALVDAVGGAAGGPPTMAYGLNLIGDGSNQCPECPQLGEMNERGQVLVFSDDFVKEDLDRSIWTQEIGLIRNREEQCYLDRDENIILEDGELIIRAIAGAVPDPICFQQWWGDVGVTQGAYSSAALTTKDNGVFKYGHIEARIKVPAATGAWPAFWMRPQERVYGGWPKSGEIDIMEYVSQEPDVLHGTVHFDRNGHAYDSGVGMTTAPLPDNFHTYSIDWTEDRIDWFFEGQLYHSFDLTPDILGRRPFNESFYLLINFAVGGHWPETPDPADYPADMRVDWVRVWQTPPQ